MKCPTCKDVTLTMSERQGIEIDYCPECRGVWLDRGELDKIIEKASNEQIAAAEAARPQQPQQQPQQAYAPPPQSYPHPQQHHYSKDYYKHKSTKSFLKELFD